MSVETKITSFKEALYENGDEFQHPRLAKRQRQIQETLIPQLRAQEEIATVNGLKDKYPQLFPSIVDQGLIITPYDQFEGMEVGIPDEDCIEGWAKTREYNLRLANNPDRIDAMMELEKRGFSPPKQVHGVINEILARKTVLPQLSDLGHNVDALDGYADHYQVHRTDIFSKGPFSFVGKRVRSFVGLGAMPDINGSSLTLETTAKLHALAEVPEVGVFSDPINQARLAKTVLDNLTIDDPILNGRTNDEKQFILEHWRTSVIGVLEVDRSKALKRAKALWNVGVRSFRVYGHSVGKDVVETTKQLRNEFGNDIEIFSSQITNVNTAKACEEAGADAIIIGVGSGGRCTTAERSQLIPSNASLAWRLRGEIGIPVIGEGGAVDEVVISILVGMSGVNGSGSIGGGTFEAPGGLFFLTKDGKIFVKPYGGEASPRTKWLSKRTYPTGLPYFSEGEQSFKELVPFEESLSQKMINHWERIILAAVILGVNEGSNTISAMQNLNPSPLFEKSPTTQYLQRTH